MNNISNNLTNEFEGIVTDLECMMDTVIAKYSPDDLSKQYNMWLTAKSIAKYLDVNADIWLKELNETLIEINDPELTKTFNRQIKTVESNLRILDKFTEY